MADPLDVIDKTVARSNLGGFTSDDSLLGIYITGVSRLLDRYFGAIIKRTVTNELHDGGLPFIWLRQGPATTITTVEEAQGTTTVTCTAQTFGTAPSEGYLAEAHTTATAPFSGRLWRTTGGYRSSWACGSGTVRVTYQGGRYTAIADVDPRFTEAALYCLKAAWRAEQYGGGAGVPDFGEAPTSFFPGFVLPRAVRELLSDELRTVAIA